ncbi:MAG: bifunctional (p)ppGpp synthetase/guanosine-3',5'-bis(diphosphate) 3'-pyrophosphohydrolase [Planctomycetes bacterium]|nr:bifunctional (p)ppGpp synthetase/guanosine-3',5'-bis(diphosphate) 3'-pyrophosphohydrolase [Planctomycetota bacterium]
MISSSVERALRACIEAHDGQFRKGKDAAPYAVHPTHMAILLARVGAPDHVIEAALLHDTVEDCDDWTLERVAAEFGDDVAQLVAAVTEDKSLSWAERKQRAVDHVPHMSADAILVKAADKLHNLASLIVELENAEDRDVVWANFKGGRGETLRMSRALVAQLAARLPEALAAELRAAVERVAELA